MKSLLTNLVLWILFSHDAIAGDYWIWQNPFPEGNTLNDAFVINRNTVVAVGNNGTILKTIDGGSTWNRQNSNTSQYLYDVFFQNENQGWAVGYSSLLKTTDAGANWASVWDHPEDNFFSIYFTDPDHGWAVGHFETILNTIDGGQNWTVQRNGGNESLLA